MNAIHKAWGLGLILLAAGCNEKNAAGSDKAPGEKTPPGKALSQAKTETSELRKADPGIGGQNQAIPRATFRNLLAVGGTAESRNKFVMELEAAATKSGTKATDVAARLVLEKPTIEEKKGSLPEIMVCFPSTQDRIDLYDALKQADLRTLLSQATTQDLLAKKDEGGLTAFYEALPVGKDRSRFSAEVSKSIADEKGVASAAGYISNLEMPEEQYAALEGVIMTDAGSPRALTEEEAKGLVKAGGKLSGEQKEVIESLLRQK